MYLVVDAMSFIVAQSDGPSRRVTLLLIAHVLLKRPDAELRRSLCREIIFEP